AGPLDAGGQRPGRVRVVDQRHRAPCLVAGPVGGGDDHLVVALAQGGPVDLHVEVARLQQAGVVVADRQRLLGTAVQRPGQRLDVTVGVGDPPEHVGPLLRVAGGADVLDVAVPDVDDRGRALRRRRERRRPDDHARRRRDGHQPPRARAPPVRSRSPHLPPPVPAEAPSARRAAGTLADRRGRWRDPSSTTQRGRPPATVAPAGQDPTAGGGGTCSSVWSCAPTTGRRACADPWGRCWRRRRRTSRWWWPTTARPTTPPLSSRTTTPPTCATCGAPTAASRPPATPACARRAGSSSSSSTTTTGPSPTGCARSPVPSTRAPASSAAAAGCTTPTAPTPRCTSPARCRRR